MIKTKLFWTFILFFSYLVAVYTIVYTMSYLLMSTPNPTRLIPFEVLMILFLGMTLGSLVAILKPSLVVEKEDQQ
jgi:hypothetical protein